MAKVFIFALAAALFVAAFAFEFDDEEHDTDLEFLKRDPEMQDYMLAEKRGRNLKKYKYCQGISGQDCWCSRRRNKIVFCSGAGNGDNM